MTKSRFVAAAALLAVAGAAHADFSVTPTLTSDYDFRGISQTSKDPAFQLNLGYTHESGFYAGIWGSNVDFGSPKPDIELDYTVGFAGGDAAESVGYDVGVAYYTYPKFKDANYPEIYAGVSKGMFSGKVWYSPDVLDSTSWYTEGNGTFPLPNDFAFTAHAGYSFGHYWDSNKYFDWSVGVTKSFGNFATALKFVDGSDLADLDGSGCTGKVCDVFSTDRKVMFSISTTLPWSAE
jgi:uncharacterized protein (TIGR02001 family)